MKKKEKLVSVKLSETEAGNLDAAAEYRNTTRSDVIRQALASYLVYDRESPAAGSVLDLARDLAGCVEDEEDLSTHPRHMEGYGE